jgi:hypothetical protein
VCGFNKGGWYFWRANVFSSAPDTARLNTALSVYSPIPCGFDVFLDLEDGRDGAFEVFVTFVFGIDDPGR